MKYKAVLKEKNKLYRDIYQFLFYLEDKYIFYSGQWIDFFINIDNKEYIGGYSIVSTSLDKGILELAIKYSNRNKTADYLHNTAKIGEVFSISEAQGDIYFNPQINKDIVLIAGGIGITPLISIFKYANQIKYKFNIELLYTASNTESLIYKKDIDNIVISNKLSKVKYFITDKEDKNFTNRINKSNLDKYINTDKVFFLCGPKKMIEELSNILLDLNIKKDNILYEKWW